MKEERVLRYREKLRYVEDHLSELPGKPEGDLELGGVFYYIHTSVEAGMDLLAMMLKDMGNVVDDDYTNIERLEDDGVLSPSLADELKSCNGLRNHLVHRYNSFDEEIAVESIDEVRSALNELSEVVEEFLNERD